MLLKKIVILEDILELYVKKQSLFYFDYYFLIVFISHKLLLDPSDKSHIDAKNNHENLYIILEYQFYSDIPYYTCFGLLILCIFLLVL